MNHQKEHYHDFQCRTLNIGSNTGKYQKSNVGCHQAPVVSQTKKAHTRLQVGGYGRKQENIEKKLRWTEILREQKMRYNAIIQSFT